MRDLFAAVGSGLAACGSLVAIWVALSTIIGSTRDQRELQMVTQILDAGDELPEEERRFWRRQRDVVALRIKSRLLYPPRAFIGPVFTALFVLWGSGSLGYGWVDLLPDWRWSYLIYSPIAPEASPLMTALLAAALYGMAAANFFKVRDAQRAVRRLPVANQKLARWRFCALALTCHLAGLLLAVRADRSIADAATVMGMVNVVLILLALDRAHHLHGYTNRASGG